MNRGIFVRISDVLEESKYLEISVGIPERITVKISEGYSEITPGDPSGILSLVFCGFAQKMNGISSIISVGVHQEVLL